MAALTETTAGAACPEAQPQHIDRQGALTR
jgi:hypothetical protein